MNEDRVEGASTTIQGRFEKDVGDVTGDRKLQEPGLVDQARGTGQNLCGGAQDNLRSAFEGAPRRSVKRLIEQSPRPARARSWPYWPSAPLV